MFSQPPPLSSSFTSMSSRSHCSKCSTGVPGPRLLPLFSPVSESTEFGRSLPRLVASAIASLICCFIQIWFVPTGVLTSNVGMPVSWQIAPSTVGGLIDVLPDDGQRLLRPRALVFLVQRVPHGRAHVGRQVGGGLDDQRHHRVEEAGKHPISVAWSALTRGKGLARKREKNDPDEPLRRAGESVTESSGRANAGRPLTARELPRCRAEPS